MQTNKGNKFLFYCLLVLCVLTSSLYLDIIDFWLVDVLSQFSFQYALSALGLLLISLWRKTISLAVLAGLLIFLNLGVLVDPGESVHAASNTGKKFKIYSANLYIHNKELSKLNYDLQKMDPEMVLLLEVTPEHLNQLRLLMQTYPYHVKKTFVRDDHEMGFMFLSKFPILNTQLTRLSDGCNFVLQATLEINERQVMFYGVHAQRPDTGNYNGRKEQFLWLAHQLREQTVPVIVSGDFNATPSSSLFQQLIRISGLRDSRTGFGWQPSWPTYFPLLWIPIDHMLVSPGIHVHNRATGSYIGSDHYPIYAELSIS